MKAIIGSLVVGLVLAAGASTSSAAAYKVPFDLRSKGVETKGRAHAFGKVQLQQDWRGKRRVVVKGRLNDICPADGYGAYLDTRIYHSDRYSSPDWARDTRGCKAKRPKRIVMRTRWVSHPSRITIRLFEFDMEAGDIARRDADMVEYAPEDLQPYWWR